MTDYINPNSDDKLANYNDFNNGFMTYNSASPSPNYIGVNALNFQLPQIQDNNIGPGALPFTPSRMESTIGNEEGLGENLIKPEDKAPIIPFKRMNIPKNAITDLIDKGNYTDSQKEYLKVLGQRESDFNPNAVATSKGKSYRGVYQFGDGALSQIGMKPADYDSNINNQFTAALKFGQMNIAPYKALIGKTVDGVKITENGLMAAAHLGGSGGLKALLNGEIRKDKFGTSTLDYMKLFDK